MPHDHETATPRSIPYYPGERVATNSWLQNPRNARMHSTAWGSFANSVRQDIGITPSEVRFSLEATPDWVEGEISRSITIRRQQERFRSAGGEFLKGCAQAIALHGYALYEIVPSSVEERPWSRCYPINPGTVKRDSGRLLQYVPKEDRDQSGGERFVQIPPGRVRTIEPGKELRDQLDEMVEELIELRPLSSLRPRIQTGTHGRLQLTTLALGKAIAWSGWDRMIQTRQRSGVYRGILHIRWNRLLGRLREVILEGLNSIVDEISQEAAVRAEMTVEDPLSDINLDRLEEGLLSGDVTILRIYDLL